MTLPSAVRTAEPQLVVWAVDDPADAGPVTGDLRERIDGLAPGDVAAFVMTWNQTQHGAYRGAFLTGRRDPIPPRAVPADGPRPIVLMLPGQGAQHTRMAAGLYGADPVFTAAMDETLDLFGADALAIRADWLATDGSPDGIDDVDRAQPLLFAVDYAMARMVTSWGVRPSALLGHSAGEVVAAVLAGVWSLADAVAVQRSRIGMAPRAPRGGMLAVAAGPADVAPYLGANVVVGVHNAPRRVLLSGPDADLDSVAGRLRENGFQCRRLGSTYPFHSPAMAPALVGAVELYAGLPLRAPEIPIWSCYTGALMTGDDATNPEYWAIQPAAMVRFADALDAVLTDRPCLLVEAGPGQSLTSLAAAHPDVLSRRSGAVAALPARAGAPGNDRVAALKAAARIWIDGYDLDWAAVARLSADPSLF